MLLVDPRRTGTVDAQPGPAGRLQRPDRRSRRVARRDDRRHHANRPGGAARGIRHTPRRPLSSRRRPPHFRHSSQRATDRRIPLDSCGAPPPDELSQALAEAAGPAGTREAERILATRLAGAEAGSQSDEALAERAVDAVSPSPRRASGCGRRPPRSASGERRLQRAFDRSVGLSPKVLARVLRFRRAVRQLDGAASDAGLLGRDWLPLPGMPTSPTSFASFGRLAGLTPAAYLRERRAVGFVQYGETRTG